MLETLRVQERRVKGKKDRELLETMKENSGKKKQKTKNKTKKGRERVLKKKKTKRIKILPKKKKDQCFALKLAK